MTYKENELNDNGKKRLSIINSTDSLGSGFNIASQDLDMRGGGSIIGEEQSGFIREIGTELYHQMLEEEIIFQKQKISKDEKIKNIFQPTIKIPEEIFIPEDYIDDLDLRISIYKRISSVNNDKELSSLVIELRDRFGNVPKQLLNLFSLIEIKILCIKYNIDSFEFTRKGIVIGFYNNKPTNSQKLLDLTMVRNSQYILRPDQKIFYDFRGNLEDNRFNLSKKIIEQIK